MTSWSTSRPNQRVTAIPPVDVELTAFREECFAWETLAESLGNVVRVDAQNRGRPDHTSIGAALRAVLGSCSAGNPFIIQFEDGAQFDPNAWSTESDADVLATLTGLEGGLVIRGRGPEATSWFVPWAFSGYGLFSSGYGPLLVNSSSVFVRDLCLGRALGAGSGLIRSVTSTGAPCRLVSPDFETDSGAGLWNDYCCAPPGGHAIQVNRTAASPRCRLMLFNCRLDNDYDLCVYSGPTSYFGFGGDYTALESDLFIAEDCTVVGWFASPPVLNDNSDSFGFGDGCLKFWLKNITHYAQSLHRPFWFIGAASGGSPFVWAQVPDEYGWIENYRLKKTNPNTSQGPVFVGGGPSLYAQHYYFDDCIFELEATDIKTSEDGAYGPGVVKSAYQNAAPKDYKFGGFVHWAVSGEPAQSEVIFRNCTFRADLTGMADALVRDGETSTVRFVSFNVTDMGSPSWPDPVTPSARSRLVIQDCKTDIRGRGEDKALYLESYNQYPEIVEIVTE